MKYIIVIDPGLVEWAWVIFDENGEIIKSKNIKLDKKHTQERRLNEVYKEISSITSVEKIIIDVAVIEKQFMNLMIQINGAIKAASDVINCKTFFFVPSEWKKLTTGKGNISEKELADKIISIYPEAKDMSEHERDCLGMFIAYKKIIDEDNEVGDNVIPKNTKANSKRKKPSKN